MLLRYWTEYQDMADNQLVWLAAGTALGLSIGVAVLMARQQQQQSRTQANLTSHTVTRDQQGRILSVETVEGLPLERTGTTLKPVEEGSNA